MPATGGGAGWRGVAGLTVGVGYSGLAWLSNRGAPVLARHRAYSLSAQSQIPLTHYVPGTSNNIDPYPVQKLATARVKIFNLTTRSTMKVNIDNIEDWPPSPGDTLLGMRDRWILPPTIN